MTRRNLLKQLVASVPTRGLAMAAQRGTEMNGADAILSLDDVTVNGKRVTADELKGNSK